MSRIPSARSGATGEATARATIAHGSSVPAAERVPVVARLRRSLARAVDGDRVIEPDERLLVACSGGPDSSALLDAVVRLAPPRRWSIRVAHIDHGLRPDSFQDLAIVRKLCANYSLPLDTARLQIGPGGSLQDRARVARYRALEDLADAHAAGAIVLGHTADDQAETVLMRALSGATPRALAGIPQRRGRRRRPLLGVWRADTAAYCAARDIVIVDDPSNRDPRFLRSRVRHELLPTLESVYPAARRRLIALADHQRRILDGAADG